MSFEQDSVPPLKEGTKQGQGKSEWRIAETSGADFLSQM
jgi:hypothetical protein